MPYWGIVNLPRGRRHDDTCECYSESGRRNLGKLGQLALCNEPGCKLFAIA